MGHILHPPLTPHNCLFNASTHDISPLGRNGIFQFQMSAKEKGPRLKFSLNGQPEKKKKKNEAASRLGTPLLPVFFPCSIHHSLAARTPGQRQLLTFPSRLPAVAGPSSVAAPPSPPPPVPWQPRRPLPPQFRGSPAVPPLPGSMAAPPSPRQLSPRPVAVACLIGQWGSSSDPLTGT